MGSLPVPGAPGQFSFVRKEDRESDVDVGNMAGAFARKALRDEFSNSDGSLMADFESVLSGECIYLPEFHCGKDDFGLLAGLAKDMQAQTQNSAQDGSDGGMINWSQHLKHENPEFSVTFKKIVKELAEYFDVEVYATRLNFYRDGSDWKPFHHDSHAFGGRSLREDFTVGASFGAERTLAFLHEKTNSQFSFPQNNGDVFAFTTEVNKRFKHGVPKLNSGGASTAGPRFSIIAWGRRRSLNPRNGGTVSCGDGESVAQARARLLTRDERDDENGFNSSPSGRRSRDPDTELAMGSGEVTTLIANFLRERADRVHQKRAASSSGNKLAGGLGKKRVTSMDALAAAAAMCVPPGTPDAETRGSAPLTATTRAELGEGVFVKLRETARAFQRRDINATQLFSRARQVAGVAGVNALKAFATHLPDAEKKGELAAAMAAATGGAGE